MDIAAKLVFLSVVVILFQFAHPSTFYPNEVTEHFSVSKDGPRTSIMCRDPSASHGVLTLLSHFESVARQKNGCSSNQQRVWPTRATGLRVFDVDEFIRTDGIRNRLFWVIRGCRTFVRPHARAKYI